MQSCLSSLLAPQAICRATKQHILIEGLKMNIIRSFNNWRRYRDTVSELNRLSNRELGDLGISRSDIPYIARKSNPAAM